MTRIFFVLTFFFVLAFSSIVAKAQDTRSWASNIFVQLQPTKEPGAVAQVVFFNDLIHTRDETFSLVMDGLKVDVIFEFNVDGEQERITVIPPEGYIALPETIDVPDGQAGILYIFQSGLS